MLDWIRTLLAGFLAPRPAVAVTPRQSPTEVDPDTLAGARQDGLDGGSGMVPRHRAFTDKDAGGLAHSLGHDQVVSPAQIDGGRIPESWYADRPLYGGVRTMGAYDEYIAEPGMTGGYTTIQGRLPFVLGDAITADIDSAAEVRVVPVPEVCRRVPGGAL